MQESHSIAAVCGDRNEIHPEATIFNRIFDLDWNGPAGEVEYVGGDALFRRSALEQAEGYDDTLRGGEEPELCTRLRLSGWTILRIAGPMTSHDLAMQYFSQYWRRQIRTGYAYAEVSARFRNTAHPLWKKESAGNRNRAVILITAMLLAIGVAIWIRNVSPILLLLVFILLLGLRTAAKTIQAGRTKDGVTAMLYGLNSHMQQIPIFIGQLQFWLRRK